MKTVKVLTVSWLFIFAFALVSCSGSKGVSTGEAKHISKKRGPKSNKVKPKEVNLSLADYLRRIPGVRVSGSGDNVSVMVRSGASVSQSDEPLFVINGTQVGNDYSQAASMVDVVDIESVEVLKDLTSTASYGLRGSFGVILIRTKSSN